MNGANHVRPHGWPRHRNLTSFEEQALNAGLNVSDGHPRMPLTDRQRDIIDSMTGLFDEALKRSFASIEEEAQREFLHGIGQHSAPTGAERMVSCYSSSVAMDIVARTLAERTSDVALIHPTFDNIADLLRSRGLRLHPLSEEQLESGDFELADSVGAVFATTPNNPTGWVLSEPGLRRLAQYCKDSNRVLALDTCFRAQDVRAQYDTYRCLDEVGPEWVIIEDTGKLWPTLELKVGFLAWGERTDLALHEAFSDVLLSVSPFVLLLITHLARDGVNGGYAELHRLIADNRRQLETALEGTPLVLTDPDSRISVARVDVRATGHPATDVYDRLSRRGVHTLPCDAFHWARNEEGSGLLRVALARSPEEVEVAARALADVAGRGVTGAS